MKHSLGRKLLREAIDLLIKNYKDTCRKSYQLIIDIDSYLT